MRGRAQQQQLGRRGDRRGAADQGADLGADQGADQGAGRQDKDVDPAGPAEGDSQGADRAAAVAEDSLCRKHDKLKGGWGEIIKLK